MQRLTIAVLLALLALFLIGNGLYPAPDQAAPGQMDQTQALSETPEPAQFAEPTAVTVTPPADDSVLIWWPASLNPEAGSQAEDLLRSQLAEFRSVRTYAVTLRAKRSEGTGGIYETLRVGSQVAPSAMPDLALMRYSQIARAASARLIQPIDLQELGYTDLFLPGLALGEVQNMLYGLPYVLELQHAAYRSAAFTDPPVTLDDLLKSEQPFLFPARPLRSVNATFLAQYIAAGGRVVSGDGSELLDRDPLVTVLSYYEQAVKNDILKPELLLSYSSPASYWTEFMAGRANIVQIDSSTYLAQRAGGMPVSGPSAIRVAALPMPGDNPPAIVDGWLWVLTTSEPNRKARALQVIAWLMDGQRQGALTRALGVLPSRRSALDTWTDDSYADFVRAQLNRPAIPLPDMLQPTVASALQQAFEDVVNRRKTADAAADEAVKKIKGS